MFVCVSQNTTKNLSLFLKLIVTLLRFAVCQYNVIGNTKICLEFMSEKMNLKSWDVHQESQISVLKVLVLKLLLSVKLSL